MNPESPTTAFDEAAFGAGVPSASMPQAHTAADSWRRAVALGGQGHYARARVELVRTRRLAGNAANPYLSLAASTRASLLRQLGWHALAAEYDGAALHATAAVDDVGTQIARCDALTGLAADALGTFRLPLAHRLLRDCGELLDSREDDPRFWRARVRLHWVGAELALAGAEPALALRHAGRAVELADAGPSTRHRIKSQLVLAAAHCALGAVEVATELAGDVERRCAEHGLVPLRWAAAMLSTGLTGDRRSADVAARCRKIVGERGGTFNDPV